jgi:hypothetical protein
VTATTEWWARAACASSNPRQFFASNSEAGKAVCGRCPVRAECLYEALESDAPNGLWGGLSRAERDKLPAFTGPRTTVIAQLRDLLDSIEDAQDATPERTEPPMADTSTSVAEAEKLPVGKLLAWGDAHLDTDVQEQSARARAALVGLRQRYTAEQELAQINAEAEQLEQRLAELQARKAQLAPAKPKKTRKPVDYPAAEVRAWAEATGHECPAVGRVPKRVVDAWRTATGQAEGSQQ